MDDAEGTNHSSTQQQPAIFQVKQQARLYVLGFVLWFVGMVIWTFTYSRGIYASLDSLLLKALYGWSAIVLTWEVSSFLTRNRSKDGVKLLFWLLGLLWKYGIPLAAVFAFRQVSIILNFNAVYIIQTVGLLTAVYVLYGILLFGSGFFSISAVVLFLLLVPVTIYHAIKEGLISSPSPPSFGKSFWREALGVAGIVRHSLPWAGRILGCIALAWLAFSGWSFIQTKNVEIDKLSRGVVFWAGAYHSSTDCSNISPAEAITFIDPDNVSVAMYDPDHWIKFELRRCDRVR